MSKQKRVTTTSKLSLEPNPFEQSFSFVKEEDKEQEDKPQQQKIKLPPVTALSGPVNEKDINGGRWGPESLRSGPLSPAMLVGPTTAVTTQPQPVVAVTGPGKLTPRLGMTDPMLHTGLTPFISGELQPTATTLAADNNNSNPAAVAPGFKIPSSLATPGIQAMLNAAINGDEITSTPGGSLRITAAKNNIDHTANTNVLHHMPMDVSSTSMPPPQPTIVSTAQPQLKRKLTTSPVHLSTIPNNDNVPIKEGQFTGRRRHRQQQQQQQTEPSEDKDDEQIEKEEKRRQFLERNRIAALKCRQRKKQQLKELQERHDYMVQGNERLQSQYMQLREQALHMRALLTAHANCNVAQANGVIGAENLPPGMPSLSLQPLLAAGTSEAESARAMIAAIPPAANGIPVHGIDPATGKPVLLTNQPPQPVSSVLTQNLPMK